MKGRENGIFACKRWSPFAYVGRRPFEPQLFCFLHWPPPTTFLWPRAERRGEVEGGKYVFPVPFRKAKIIIMEGRPGGRGEGGGIGLDRLTSAKKKSPVENNRSSPGVGEGEG